MLNIVILNVEKRIDKAVRTLRQCRNIKNKDSFVEDIKVWHAVPFEKCNGVFVKFNKKNSSNYSSYCEESNTRSIVNILKYAKEHNWEYFLLLEDDSYFEENNINYLQKYIENLPDKFSICYAGGYLYKYVHKGFKKYNDCWLECCNRNKYYDIWGNHGSIIHNSVYDAIIKELEMFDHNISDFVIKRSIHNIKDLNFFIANPLVIHQYNGEDMHKINYDMIRRRHTKLVNLSMV